MVGIDKGKKAKVLEKEILAGEHEKVQGGYGKYQGTWISYRRGREFCRQHEFATVQHSNFQIRRNAQQTKATQVMKEMEATKRQVRWINLPYMTKPNMKMVRMTMKKDTVTKI